VATVAWLNVAPVKGLRLASREEIRLERFGVLGDRAFYLVDDEGRLVNAKRHGRLLSVEAEYDVARDVLALTLPDGRRVEGVPERGEAIATDFYGGNTRGHLVEGPWSDGLSEVVGAPLRLARAEEPGTALDRGLRGGAITILSTASLAKLGAAAGVTDVDPRRFRMLIGVDGIAAHEEDEWLGREVAVGEAVVVPRGHVGRCAVTTKDPENGERTLDTLAALAAYREDGTEKLPFGVWGEVAKPGRVRVGDPVEPI
jgi:uncharacterized protein YcbX